MKDFKNQHRTRQKHAYIQNFYEKKPYQNMIHDQKILIKNEANASALRKSKINNNSQICLKTFLKDNTHKNKESLPILCNRLKFYINEFPGVGQYKIKYPDKKLFNIAFPIATIPKKPLNIYDKYLEALPRLKNIPVPDFSKQLAHTRYIIYIYIYI